MKDIILNHEQTLNKIKRIAYQIYESNVNENEVIIAGIKDKGSQLAVLIKNELEKISDINIILCDVNIDKKNPQNTITTSINSKVYENKSLVLVDDVLNSGTTLMYAVKHFLEVKLKRFKTAILVNRNHKKYPVKADFKGVSLSTSLKEHVEVELNANNFKAYLV